MEPLAVLLFVAVGAMVAVVVAIMMMRARKIKAVRDRFGSEYGHALEETGSRHKAAALLHQREKRVERFKLTPIDADKRQALDARWTQAQTGFLTSPLGAVSTADALLDDVLTARGYPDAKFEQRAADLSVHYPELVHPYRTAHEFALRDEAEELNTEELRQAMLAYKALYDEIVGPAANAVPAQVLDVEPQRVEAADAPAELEFAERSAEAQRAAAHLDDEGDLSSDEAANDDRNVLAIVDGKKLKATIEDGRRSG